MHELNEKVEIINAIYPVSQSAGGNAASEAADLSRYDGILFSLACGTVESGKKVVLTAEESDDESMTSAAEIGSVKQSRRRFSAVAQLYYLPRRFRLFIIQDRLLHGRFIVILGGIVVAVFFLFA